MKAMACPICTTLERDERLLREAVEERVEALRWNLPADVRAEGRCVSRRDLAEPCRRRSARRCRRGSVSDQS